MLRNVYQILIQIEENGYTVTYITKTLRTGIQLFGVQ
jgi:hypothetical protein